MTLAAGDLRDHVAIYRPEHGRQGAEPVLGWAFWCRRSAEVRSLSGLETETAAQRVGETTHLVRLRWETQFEALDQTCRIELGGRNLNIVSVRRAGYHRDELELLCTETPLEPV